MGELAVPSPRWRSAGGLPLSQLNVIYRRIHASMAFGEGWSLLKNLDTTHSLAASRVMNDGDLWNKRPIGESQCFHFQLGPLEVYVTRYLREWQFFYRYAEQPLTDVVSAFEDEDPPKRGDMADFEHVRISDAHSTDDISLRLKLLPADRPVVARPSEPVYIIEKGSADWYVTTPAWIQFVREPGGAVLQTIPTWRPTDTWFGPPTGSGPLCYASRTKAYHVLEELPHHALRIVTHTILKNSGSALNVERIVVPTPNLKVWSNENGRLWTQSVTLERGADGQLTGARALHAPPDIAGNCTRVSDGHPQDESRINLRGLMDTLFR
jgi:hypothetical protein